MEWPMVQPEVDLLRLLLPRAMHGELCLPSSKPPKTAKFCSNRLIAWLAYSTPRVILINKTFNFKGTEGTAASTGCYQKCCPLTNGGQDCIGTISCTANSNIQATTVTYDKAGTNPLIVGSNKSIVGVGSAGVIMSKGLKQGTSKNVIIQNLHVTVRGPLGSLCLQLC